jgi:hypothetical protein
MIDRSTQLSDPLILARLTAKRAKVIDRDHEGRGPGRWGCSTGDVYDVYGLEKSVHGEPETPTPER